MALPKYLQSSLLVLGGVAAGVAVMMFMQPAQQATTPTRGTAAGENAASISTDAALTESDPLSVLSRAISTADRDTRAETLRALAVRLVGEDVKKALAVAAKIPDVDDKLEFLRALFGAWAARDPKAAMEYAKANFTAGLQQSESLVAAVEKWGAASPRDAWLWVDANLSGPLKEEATTSLVQGWARTDPEAAAGWFISTGSTSQSVLDALVTTWTGLHPQAAAAWVESLTNPANKETGRILVASEWSRQNPAESAANFTPMLTIDLGSAIVNSWAANDPASTATWVAKLPPGEARTNAAGTLATVWAASDITAAVKWSDTITDADLRNGIIDHLGTTWGAIEPVKALAWIATLPADEARTEATKGALNSWAGTNPDTMKTWLTTQPPGPTADEARVSLAAVYSDSDRAESMRQSLAITDASARGDAASKFFLNWRRNDDAAAQKWLQAEWPRLSPDVQARLEKEQKRKY